jgi:BirA family biotin operon repressor/biotin-[acetyl-CoA-carboxylase] ligase
MINQSSPLIGQNIIYLKEVDSTNEYIKRYLNSGRLTAGTVVVAELQSQGKGRAGRKWDSPRGGLWFSVLLRPEIPLERMALLSLVFAVGISQALNKFIDVNCQLKWPNDIYISDKKLAGILLESVNSAHNNSLIVGVGINMNLDKNTLSPANRELAANLSDYSPVILDRSHILSAVLQYMDIYYKLFLDAGFDAILPEYKAHCRHLNQPISVNSAGRVITGINIDIDTSGKLIIDTGRKIEEISAGDVNVL